jgi:hypothetical protein
MTSALQEYLTALRNFRIRLHEAQIQAQRIVIEELKLGDEDASVTALTSTETALAFAAKRLVRAADELPQERRPRGWGDA